MFAVFDRDLGYRAVDARWMFYCLAFLAGTLSMTDLQAQPTIDFLSRSGRRLAPGRYGPTVIAQRCSLRIRGLEPNDSLQILIDGAVARQAQCDGHLMMMPLKGLALGWHTAEVKVTRRRNREVTQTRKTVERFPDRETTTTVEERLGNAEVLFATPQSFEVVSQFGPSAGVRALGFARLCSADGNAETMAHDANDLRPFAVLPTVTRLLDPQSAVPPGASPAMLTVQGAPPAASPRASDQAGWLTFCFDDPARFRLPEFSSCGGQLPTVGAVIYEGMRFRVGPEGRYRVSFELGAPSMPLTLSMQLGLVSGAFGVQTLTLPPISIPPADKRSSAKAGIYLVQHEGWHPQLASDVDELHTITRDRTTCRFGFGLDVP